MNPRSLDLSVCSIVRDEEANIPALAACLPLNRVEWVVLDTGSRDGTARLLRERGVEPVPFAWIDDFAAARNASLRLATRGWILWLDADDRLEPGFWEDLAPLLSGPRRAYRFIVRSPREGSRGERFRQIRLFPNGLGLAFEGRIHEQLGTSLRRQGAEAVDADLEIVHLGYDSAEKREAKRRRNLTLLEAERREHPADPTVAMEYGNCLYQGGDHRAAREVYFAFLPARDPARCGSAPSDEVLRHFPSLVAEASLRLGEESAAEGWFDLASRWNPDDLMPWYWLGKRALGRGDLRAALGRFHEALDRPVTVGRVATDNATIRRNALGLTALCEIAAFGAANAPRAGACLLELLASPEEGLPLDPRVLFEFWRDRGDTASLEAFARVGLPRWTGDGPADLALWEDVLEQLLAAERPETVLAALSARPDLDLRSGTLEAFRGRALEELGGDPSRAYEAYRRALAAFPEDPTVLVYFSSFVNENRLYTRCYADLKAIPAPSATVKDFLKQLETQGLAG